MLHYRGHVLVHILQTQLYFGVDKQQTRDIVGHNHLSRMGQTGLMSSPASLALKNNWASKLLFMNLFSFVPHKTGDIEHCCVHSELQ